MDNFTSVDSTFIVESCRNATQRLLKQMLEEKATSLKTHTQNMTIFLLLTLSIFVFSKKFLNFLNLII